MATIRWAKEQNRAERQREKDINHNIVQGLDLGLEKNRKPHNELALKSRNNWKQFDPICL